MRQEDPSSDMGRVLNLRVSVITMGLVGRVQPGALHPSTEELDFSVLSIKRKTKVPPPKKFLRSYMANRGGLGRMGEDPVGTVAFTVRGFPFSGELLGRRFVGPPCPEFPV